jgi:hypothetical protein
MISIESTMLCDRRQPLEGRFVPEGFSISDFGATLRQAMRSALCTSRRDSE